MAGRKLQHTNGPENQLLLEAWNERNATQFQNCLSENLDIAQINEIVREIVVNASDDEYTSARFTFAKIIFENHLHRKAFLGDKSLIFHLLEVGNSKILELLLQYMPNLRKTSEGGNSPLHFLCNRSWQRRKESCVACMNLLLNHAEINVNALNNEYRSPLDLAITCKNLDAVEMLLNSPKNVYLDRKYHDRPTAREEITNFFPDLIKTLPKKATDSDGITISELHLWLRNEKDENRNKFIEKFPTAMQNTLLIDELTCNMNLFLQEACENNLMDQVKLLMNYGADPSVEDKWNDSRSAITVAVENGHIDILALLLERASVINYKLDNSRKVEDKVHAKDDDGNTALHHAVRYGNDKAMLEILKLGGYLGAENAKNENPLEKIPARVLQKFLNSQLKQVKNETTRTNQTAIPMESGSSLTVKQFGYNREKFNFDCRFLTRPKQSEKLANISPDMKLLKQMTEIKELRPLLTHPVLRSFTLLKWEKLKIIFYVNLILYALINSLLTLNILTVLLTGNDMNTVPRSLQGLLILLLLLQGIMQLLIRGKRFIKQSENILVLLIIGIGAYLCIQTTSDIYIFRHLGASILLVCWLGFLLFIGKHPLFSIQVEMFRMVLLSFVKFLSVYLIIILAFALSFFVLFNECDDVCPTEFKNVGQSIFKTFVMVSGEFDLTDMPFKNYPGTSHVIFLLFLFLVAIVLLNLLNGLAVYDTKKIKEYALLHSNISRVRYLASLEELLYGVRHWSFFKKLTDHFLIFECQIVDSETELYELDHDILKDSREIAVENAKDKDLVEMEVKQLMDSDKRSESDERLMKLVMDLTRKMDEVDRKLNLKLSISKSGFPLKL